MGNWKNCLCLLLAVLMLSGAVMVPVYAEEETAQMEEAMNSSSNSMSFGAEDTLQETEETLPVEETFPEESTPEETIAEETESEEAAPEETEPAEAVPEETEPAEAVPEETEPEEVLSEETTPEETGASAAEESQPEEEEESIPDRTEETSYLVDSLYAADVPEGGILNDVPLMFQTDYPDIPYSDGTIATSGCSLVSIAMVSTYLRGEECNPADLARRFGNYDASNLQRMESAATVMDLYYEKTFLWEDVVMALQNGKVVIVLVDNRTCFTETQHFLVLTGITEDGKIHVNDSYAPNYTKWELRDGYCAGFEPGMITAGFGGAWIFEHYVEPEKVPTRYTDVVLTEEEKYLMAKIIWLEARGETFEGQQAIAEIILNRLVSNRFPNTIRDVIYAEGQFSTVKFLDTAKPGELQYKAIESAMTEHSVLPIDVYFFGREPRTSKIWGRIGGHVFCFSEY